MGLLDNLDDPQKQALMAMAMGLLQGAPQGRKNIGADIGNAGLMGLQAYGGARQDKRRDAEDARRNELATMQNEQMRQQMAEQAAMRGAMQKNFQPGMPQMQPTDMETPTGPQGPSTFNAQGYARDLMGINPMMGLDMQARLQKQEPMPVSLAEGARLVDPRSGREVANNPKADGPKKGQVREVMSGARTIQYEWTGDKWEKIGEGPRFKEDGPDKPDKPPQGYRWAGNGNLEPIKGGPADPSTSKATDTERTAAGYLQRMQSAEKLMTPVEKVNGKPGWLEAAAGKAMGETAANLARSPDRQQYRQAQEDWVRSKLRKESGAVIADAEMAREIQTYFPQIGDSPQVIAQKAKARQVAVDAMRTGAGPVAPVGVDDLLKKYLGR